MAKITINIEESEKKQLLAAIKNNEGITISVAKLATQAKMNPNRARFVMQELLDEGKVERVPTKVFNPRYIRYSYKVVK